MLIPSTVMAIEVTMENTTVIFLAVEIFKNEERHILIRLPPSNPITGNKFITPTTSITRL